MNVFRKKWLIQLIGVLALCALIWFAGPLIAVAGAVPLASEVARGVTLLLVVFIWIIVLLVSRLRAQNRERQLAADLTAAPAPTELGAAEEASLEEVATLRNTFEESLRVLKEARASAKSGEQYLYELPWYIIIGAPGSGKTTALVNSGLRFPLAERFGRQAVRGISGTRNCDWWFSDEAVLLDTAGRYTTQDSHQAVDAAAWKGFLNLLKKHRPRRPVNGVLVALSLSDLLQQTEEERGMHSRAIRQRVQELYQVLGVRFPIYMLFTKTDLVAGFTDFFADMGQEERAQVWGETFPAEAEDAAGDPLDGFAARYEELLARLNLRTLKRVQEERDIQRRSLILDFPQQMALVKGALETFLRDAFGVNRYQIRPLLRGVYFTSGTQEGTPIDRVMGALAAAFRLNRQSAPMFSGQGKSFFLTRLLREVVFLESGLAGTDPRQEKRRWLLRVAVYAGAAALTLGMTGLWTVSYFKNRQAIAQVQEQIDRYKAAVPVLSGWQANFRSLLPRMDALLAADEVYRDAGWSMGWGLYQGEKLQSAARHAYQGELEINLLPLIRARLEQRLHGGAAVSDEIRYELLRVYLMLGQPERLDPKLARPWIRLDWEEAFAAEPEVLGRLGVHLDNLLALPPAAVALDQALINAVRAKLTQVPQLLQIYSRFKSEALLDHAHDLRLGDVLGAKGKVFVGADGKAVEDMVIPGLFTAHGFTQVFLVQGLGFIKDALAQNWVLGDSGKEIDLAEARRLHGDFQKLYLNEYQQTWDKLLANLKIRKGQGLNQTIDVLNVLSAPDTPLRPLLETVEKNTALLQLSTSTADALGKAAGVLTGVTQVDDKTQKLLEAAKKTGGVDSSSATEPLRMVELHFSNLHALVRGSPPPLNATLSTLSTLLGYTLQIGSGANTSDQALKTAADRMAGGGGDVLRQAQLEFSRLPEPVKGWLQSLANFGWSQTLGNARSALNDLLKSGVATPCKQALQGRYPFVRSAGQDANVADFARFFAPNGLFDQFFQANLKSFVDTNKPVWTPLSMDSQSIGLSGATIRQFQAAAKIRNAFFQGGASTPSVGFELRQLGQEAGIASVQMNIEGQNVSFGAGGVPNGSFRWPGPQAGSGAKVTLQAADGRQAVIAEDGAWAPLRLLDMGDLQATSWPDRFNLTFRSGGLAARFELRASSVDNPFNLGELRNFHCPESL